jgi:O-acetyl-ADP-ribose deacetylase (regulator of RNase III)
MTSRHADQGRHATYLIPLPRGGSSRLELEVGDLTLEDVDVIVTPVAGHGPHGGSVDLAIHRVAGPELLRALRAAAAPPDKRPVLTAGFALRARHVIHVVPPRYADDPSVAARELEGCYRGALAVAQRRGLDTIAFPSIATGAQGFPVARAAKIAIESVVAQLEQGAAGMSVRFVLFGPATYDEYLSAANLRLRPKPGA